MVKSNVYAVKRGAYFMAPMVYESNHDAVKMFVFAVNDKNTFIFKDYEICDLYYIADYNVSSGKFISLKKPILVKKGIESKLPNGEVLNEN